MIAITVAIHIILEVAGLQGEAMIAIPVVVHIILQVAAAVRLRSVRDEIGGVIQSRSDLDKVRAAIQENLFIGIFVVGNGVIMTVSFILSSGGWLWVSCLIIVLVVTQVVLWFVCRPLETQFKKLPVEGNNVDLTDEYHNYVKQWSGCHILLKAHKKDQERI